MRAVVTGGAGFIGSHLIEALVARGDEVVCVDREGASRQWIGHLDIPMRLHGLQNPDALETPQHDVVPSVGERIDMRDEPAAPDGIHGRTPRLHLHARAKQHHPDHPIAGDGIGDHLAVARLEDVQWEEHVRKENNVRQGEEGEKIGHDGVVLRCLGFWVLECTEAPTNRSTHAP